MTANGTDIPKGVVRSRLRCKGEQRQGRAIGTNGTYVEIDLYDCDAYRHLRPVATKVLLGFLMRIQVRKQNSRKRSNEFQKVNHRELVYTYDAMEFETGIGTQALSKALDELVAKGYLDLVRVGGGRNGVHSIWGLSDRYKKWHLDKSKRESMGFEEEDRVRAQGHKGFENRTVE
jgi:hypothetical protein